MNTHIVEVTRCFKVRDYNTLEEILSGMSAMTAVMLNLKVSSEANELSEEGNTLSKTLLPYLQKCENFEFIRHDFAGVAARMTASMS